MKRKPIFLARPSQRLRLRERGHWDLKEVTIQSAAAGTRWAPCSRAENSGVVRQGNGRFEKGLPAINPDRYGNEAGVSVTLNGAAQAAVPVGSADQPFTWTVPADGVVALRVTDRVTSDNQGAVVYRVTVLISECCHHVPHS